MGREAWGDSKLVGYSSGLIFRILQVVTVVGYGLEIVGYVSYTNDRPAKQGKARRRKTRQGEARRRSM